MPNKIEEVLRFVSIPTTTIDVPSSVDWASLESEFGVTLPEDFKELVSSYGAGSFDDFLVMKSPTANDDGYSLRLLITDSLEVLRTFRESNEHEERIFPESGGLFPWAATLNGDILYWRSNGNSEEWTVVLNPSRTLEFLDFAESSTSFIEGIYSGRIKTDEFPDNFPSDVPLFKMPVRV